MKRFNRAGPVFGRRQLAWTLSSGSRVRLLTNSGRVDGRQLRPRALRTRRSATVFAGAAVADVPPAAAPLASIAATSETRTTDIPGLNCGTRRNMRLPL